MTLDKSLPKSLSEEDADELRVQRISYEKAILPWLEDCKKEAASLPGVREMIGQYIHLIGHLTGRSVSKFMNDKLTTVILNSPDYLSALYTLRETTLHVQEKLLDKLDSELDLPANEFGLQRENRENQLRNLGQKESGLAFRHDQLNKHNLKICFWFDKSNYQDFYYGFASIDPEQPVSVEVQVRERFLQSFGSVLGTPNRRLPAWAYFEDPYRYWNAEAFKGIQSGYFLKRVEEKLEVMIKIAKDLV